MITLCKNTERSHIRSEQHHSRLTVFPQEPPLSRSEDFGILTGFNEIRLPPGGVAAPHPRVEAEIVTYGYRGALGQEDSTGYSGVVHAGEFQHVTVGARSRRKEKNVSLTDWAHIFRISLRPSVVGLERSHEQKRFPAAQRHNALCVVASTDGRKGSLRICQDVIICSSILDPGHHLIHELLQGRSVWLHIIVGEVTLQDIVLTQGDGVGITIEPSVSLTASENTELLLVDLGPMPK